MLLVVPLPLFWLHARLYVNVIWDPITTTATLPAPGAPTRSSPEETIRHYGRTPFQPQPSTDGLPPRDRDDPTHRSRTQYLAILAHRELDNPAILATSIDVRIIKTVTLDGFAKAHPTAAAGLAHWEAITRAAKWKNLVDTRASFPHADQVTVQSGRTVTLFNIKKNDFRLITAIHYNTRKVFILRFLTHADYGKATWKNTL